MRAEDRHADEEEDRDVLEVEAAAAVARAPPWRAAPASAGSPAIALAEPVDRGVQAAGDSRRR